MPTSIIDQPRRGDEKDLFDIDGYRQALRLFIENADTPITIALQGEWGSGKTSLMNTLQFNLAQEKSPFYSIWINTWQYSMLCEPESAIIGILKGILIQLGKMLGDEHEKNKNYSKAMLKVLKIGAIGTANIIGRYAGVANAGSDAAGAFKSVHETDAEESGNPDIADLKNEIKALIEEILKQGTPHHSKKGFLFFIDDLDRIDPPVAVKILELLKNIFDLEHCIFILAIDYDVVIKGLKPKFGELTAKNEREFRSFFDKIIQLPFAMPVSSYRIDKFLIESLHSINFLTDSEEKDKTLTTELSEFAQWSVGNNPRSLKRLTNTLSLIRLITDATRSKEDDEDFRGRKSINFALVCMQICYPAVYNALLLEPDFKEWGNALAQKLSLEPLSENEVDKLSGQEEFDEEWEQTLFRLCRKDYFLSSRVLDISRMLNRIAILIPEGERLGEIVAAVIRLSAVTNLQSSAQAAECATSAINYNYWLKKHRDALIPKVNAMLENVGQFNSVTKRVTTYLDYLFTSKSDIRQNYRFDISHDGKSYYASFSAGFHFLKGAGSANLEMEEEAIGKLGTVQKINSEFDRLKEKYGLLHDRSCTPGCLDFGAFSWFKFQYDSLEDMAREDALKKYAEFVVEYINITNQYFSIEKSCAFGQLDKLEAFCENHGVVPFAKSFNWEKTTTVLDQMSYKGNRLSLDIVLQTKSFRVSLFVRSGDSNVMPEVLQKANLTDSFPIHEKERWVNDISFGDIEKFIGDTLKQLSSLQNDQ